MAEDVSIGHTAKINNSAQEGRTGEGDCKNVIKLLRTRTGLIQEDNTDLVKSAARI